MDEMKMDDALGRAHVFFLALKKAGLSDEASVDIINAKDNVFAEAMVDTYFFMVGTNKFEFVSEFECEIPEIDTLNLLSKVQNLFFNRENIIEKQVLDVCQSKPLYPGKKRVLFYRNTATVSEQMAYSFLSNKGAVPDFLGLIALWYVQVGLLDKHIFPQGRPIFAFAERENHLVLRLLNLGEIGDSPNNYHITLESITAKTFAANNYFLVFQDIN